MRTSSLRNISLWHNCISPPGVIALALMICDVLTLLDLPLLHHRAPQHAAYHHHLPLTGSSVKAASGMGAAADKERERDGPSAALLDKVQVLDAFLRVGALRTLDLKGNDLCCRARAGEGSVGMIEESELAKSIRLDEKKIENNAVDRGSGARAYCAARGDACAARITPLPSSTDVLKQARTLTWELGNTIQTTEDPSRMEELLGVSDEPTALIAASGPSGRWARRSRPPRRRMDALRPWILLPPLVFTTIVIFGCAQSLSVRGGQLFNKSSGEIIPQAVSVRSGLSIAVRLRVHVHVAWPIAGLWDLVLGGERRRVGR
ncbi:hypothetical protein DFH07DRAFT_984106 [Mycena maculata]|uniref:Uncharacterized protein n=1 Tax=Mycena maculata TaxID=230809 RepID=A0AAD7IAG1_9AGAR|nr:hypothetical protein DFH07DRAFT_984106 [Mycena maculata]